LSLLLLRKRHLPWACNLLEIARSNGVSLLCSSQRKATTTACTHGRTCA
jgi:hypothetical protein